MQLSNRRIVESIVESLERLLRRRVLPSDVLYDVEVAVTLLRHVQYVTGAAGDDIRGYGVQVADLLTTTKNRAVTTNLADQMVARTLDTMIGEATALAASRASGDALKQCLIGLQAVLDQNMCTLSAAVPSLAQSLFAEMAPAMLKLHNGLKLFGDEPSTAAGEVSPGEPLNDANLSAYFRETLQDCAATLTDVVTLPGGFGKETTLFTLTSKVLSADLVMRRDMPIDPYEGQDCHTASKEFPVLKAMHARGFPAPEPLFHEQCSLTIVGPAFTIMRRALGSAAGDAIGGENTVSPHLQRTLAQLAARLHATPRVEELTAIGAFESSLWDATAGECTRRYLLSWYRHYQTTAHLPTPAVHTMFQWLIANLPTADRPSTLVHGDIGFHNLLFHEGQLSALLDWEFAHVGDPAEDIGYIRSLMGGQLDWPRFIADYVEAGGLMPSEQQVRFFEIWSHVRNAACTALLADHFEAGRLRNIKFGMVIYRFVPHFISRAEALISSYGDSGR